MNISGIQKPIKLKKESISRKKNPKGLIIRY